MWFWFTTKQPSAHADLRRTIPGIEGDFSPCPDGPGNTVLHLHGLLLPATGKNPEKGCVQEHQDADCQRVVMKRPALAFESMFRVRVTLIGEPKPFKS